MYIIVAILFLLSLSSKENDLPVILLNGTTLLNEDEIFADAETIFNYCNDPDNAMKVTKAWLPKNHSLEGDNHFYGEVELRKYSYKDEWKKTTAIQRTKESVSNNLRPIEDSYYYLQYD